MRDPLFELLSGPEVPVDRAVVDLRIVLDVATADLVTVPDATLESPWHWRPDDPVDADVRYGFYRIHERLEEAVGAVLVGLASRGVSPRVGPAAGLLGAATAARWELHGALAGLTDHDLDADPGGDEWSIRRTLAHIVNSQRAYGWYTAWWVDRGVVAEPLPEGADPNGTLPELPDEESEGSGSLKEVLARLDELVDAGAARFAGIGPEAMEIPARWSGMPVTVGFRIGRWGSHIREHTVQVDKTAAMVGRQPTEVERLVRLIRTSQGRLEALAFGRSADVIRARVDGGASIAEVLEAASEEIAPLARGLRAAVG